MRIVLVLTALLLANTAMAGNFTSTAIGGAGWLHSGAVLPTDSDYLLIGADVSGVYRTQNFGSTWEPWNGGLENSTGLHSHHIEDLVGIDYDGWTGFYAATMGGIYRATPTGSWALTTSINEYYYQVTADSIHRGVPFSCLDWCDTNMVVAGAGALKWQTDYSSYLSYEKSSYPSLDSTKVFAYGDSLCSDQWTVWTLDLDDNGGWVPDQESNFGTARDISVAILDSTTYIAVGTNEGIYVKTGNTWHSVGDSLYNDSLTCWSLHLTDRGTLYAAMGRAGGTCTTGVYRIFDKEDLTNPAAWTWVGDGEKVAPFEVSVRDIGGEAGVDLIYMSVVDGEEAAPDLVYLASRSKGYGLFRGYQPYSAGGSCDWYSKVYSTGTSPDFSFYYRDGSDDSHTLDIGWLDYEPAYVVFHPVVSQYYPGVVALHLGGRLHISADTANSWTQCYSDDVQGDFWVTTGYKELSERDIAFMSDGRAVSSTGDHGLFRSADSDLDVWEYIEQPTGTPSGANNVPYNRETHTVEVRYEWRNTEKDAILAISGNRAGGYSPSKLFWIDEEDTWHNLTCELYEADEYVFYDFAFVNDNRCFISYAKYSDKVGSGADSLEGFGVLRGTYNPQFEEWMWITRNNGLEARSDPDCNAIGADLFYHDATRRIFMGAREMMVTISDTTVSVPGGLYMLDSPTATDWQLIFGGEDAGYKDVRCLAQSSNGGVLYGGTRGCPCSETGTVLRCENPEADDTSMTWTALANTPSADYPFDFESPPGTGWNGDSANCWLTVVSALAVDPGDSDVVYVGLDRPGFMKQEGLYRYDGSSWEHLSEGEEFAGIGVTALEIDTTTTDSTLVIGTRGLDLYFMSTNDDPGPGECQTPPRASSRLRLLTVRSEVGGRTEIEFALDRPDCVKMKVFDVRGRLVYGRDVTIKKAGQCRLVWDGQSRPGRPCASGIYFLRLSTKDVKADRKFLLLR